MKVFYILGMGMLLSSCVHHRSFVATPFEPVLVKQKGDIQAGFGIRPFKYYALDLTVAASDNVAVRVGYGGFFNLDNVNASIIYFKNKLNTGFFIAPTFNYQHNLVHFGTPGFFGKRTSYSYNCEYYSPSLVLGFRIFGDNRVASHQFILKTQYNIVKQYNYYYFADRNFDYKVNYQVLDDESLYGRIPDFFSLEPSYVYLDPLAEIFTLKLQVGFNLCQRSFRHSYEFMARESGKPSVKEAFSKHPKYLGAFASVAIILHGNLRPRRKMVEY